MTVMCFSKQFLVKSSQSPLKGFHRIARISSTFPLFHPQQLHSANGCFDNWIFSRSVFSSNKSKINGIGCKISPKISCIALGEPPSIDCHTGEASDTVKSGFFRTTPIFVNHSRKKPQNQHEKCSRVFYAEPRVLGTCKMPKKWMRK